MRIPVYEEINLDNYDLGAVCDLFKTKKLSQVPMYIIIHHLKGEELEVALNNIAEALIMLNIHPKFPYPLYIVTRESTNHSSLPIVPSVEELPRHFHKKARRLKTKELILLSKCTILGRKVDNINLHQRFRQISKNAPSQRALFDMCKEVYFYDRVMDGINSRLDKKEREK